MKRFWKNHPIRVMLILQCVLFVLLQTQTVSSRLAFVPGELIYIPAALLFLLRQSVRVHWRKALGAWLASQALFVILFYNLREGSLSWRPGR